MSLSDLLVCQPYYMLFALLCEVLLMMFTSFVIFTKFTFVRHQMEENASRMIVLRQSFSL